MVLVAGGPKIGLFMETCTIGIYSFRILRLYLRTGVLWVVILKALDSIE